jgi:hypothetical protein
MRQHQRLFTSGKHRAIITHTKSCYTIVGPTLWYMGVSLLIIYTKNTHCGTRIHSYLVPITDVARNRLKNISSHSYCAKDIKDIYLRYLVMYIHIKYWNAHSVYNKARQMSSSSQEHVTEHFELFMIVCEYIVCAFSIWQGVYCQS